MPFKNTMQNAMLKYHAKVPCKGKNSRETTPYSEINEKSILSYKEKNGI